MRNLEQSPKPILLTDRQQIDFKNLLGDSLNGLVGIHEQLTFAIQSLHLIISEELLLEDKANTTLNVFQRCQKKIDDLKTNQKIGETEFEQLDEIFNILAYYINIQPLPRLAFLSIFNQEMNTILQEIEKNGFKFQSEKEHREETIMATSAAQKKQEKIEAEHNKQPQSISEPLLQRLRRQGPQMIFAALEFFGIVISSAAVIFGTHVSGVYLYLSIFVPGPVALCAESVSFLYNRRSLGTNLFYTLPSWLISLFTNTVEQYEIEPLLRNNASISDALINSTSYVSIPNQLEQNLSNDNSNTHIESQPTQSVTSNISQVFPEAPSPATLDEESKDKKYDLENDLQDDDKDSKLIRKVQQQNYFGSAIAQQDNCQESTKVFEP